ncbi:unnamed protein product [Brassica rapa]|uniref:Uncharacterized protein n=1 Tax=Brassica campestris TaxID=3711 RepID=A0A3P5ZIA5_BRACM|nr:unnamed protein product [Brassica rapa]VDC79832.1 unnamed protein product [Brassica rapa]
MYGKHKDQIILHFYDLPHKKTILVVSLTGLTHIHPASEFIEETFLLSVKRDLVFS